MVGLLIDEQVEPGDAHLQERLGLYDKIRKKTCKTRKKQKTRSGSSAGCFYSGFGDNSRFKRQAKSTPTHSIWQHARGEAPMLVRQKKQYPLLTSCSFRLALFLVGTLRLGPEHACLLRVWCGAAIVTGCDICYAE